LNSLRARIISGVAGEDQHVVAVVSEVECAVVELVVDILQMLVVVVVVVIRACRLV